MRSRVRLSPLPSALSYALLYASAACVSESAAFSSAAKDRCGGTGELGGAIVGLCGSFVAVNDALVDLAVPLARLVGRARRELLELVDVGVHRLGEIREVVRQHVGVGEAHRRRCPIVCASARP